MRVAYNARQAMAFPDFPPTLPVLLRTLAAQHGSRELIVTEARRISYAQAENESAELARALLASGVGKGTRVGILFPNGPDWVTTFFAVTRIGALAVPISTFYQARELGWVLRHADVQWLLCCDRMLRHEYLPRLERAAPGLAECKGEPLYVRELPHLRAVRVWGRASCDWALDGPRSFAAALRGAPAIDAAFLERVEAEVTPADAAVMVHTSGSTAEPKGAVHTHGTVVRHAANIRQYQDFVLGDRVYASMPFFWVGGLVVNVIACMYRGATLLCEEGFDPDRTLAFLSHERATVVGAWPAVIQALVQHPRLHDYDLSSVRAGNLYEVQPPERRPKDLELRTNSLGMTETCGPHCWGDMKVDLPEALRGTFGTAIPGVEHKVVDPETGARLAAGEYGEICVRGYNLCQALYKREREESFDADGYYHTGDGGWFDAEGHLFFKGRLGDMIKTAGTNVAPREVEIALEALPEVKLAAVVGVPDPVRGQIVTAAVVAEPGQRVDPDAVRARLRDELSSFKVPRHVFVLKHDEVPLTDTGKVHKQRLLELLEPRVRAIGESS
jgi:acyl-CoA synthetase (AMP-forming)/AMP-acid ligase II